MTLVCRLYVELMTPTIPSIPFLPDLVVISVP